MACMRFQHSSPPSPCPPSKSSQAGMLLLARSVPLRYILNQLGTESAGEGLRSGKCNRLDTRYTCCDHTCHCRSRACTGMGKRYQHLDNNVQVGTQAAASLAGSSIRWGRGLIPEQSLSHGNIRSPRDRAVESTNCPAMICYLQRPMCTTCFRGIRSGGAQHQVRWDQLSQLHLDRSGPADTEMTET